MILNMKIEEYKNEHVLELYRMHPDEIERDLNKETSTQGDYEGREILELLQNAVDQVDHSGKILIELKDNILTVANTGERFSFDGVKSLMKSDLSPKRIFNDTIGQKGLGFRSILNWSDDITIYSDGLSIRFTEKFRSEYFKEAGINEKTALLVAPEIIAPIDKGDYASIIKINISHPEQIEEVKRQLTNIDKYTLLFLDKISDLIVCIDDKYTKFSRKKECEIVEITENEQSYTFNTYVESGEINSQKYEIVIAYDNEIIADENKLYSFFETTIDFPIKWKVHATFDLNMDRNTIKKSDENLELLIRVIRFICNSSKKIQNLYSYEGFDSLIKRSDFPATLDIKGNDFDDIYWKEVEKTEVLPTLSGSKTSLNKSPKFYDKIPFFFNSIDEYCILDKSLEEVRNKIFSQYCSEFDADDLSDVINDKSNNWILSQRVEVFLWWCQNFPKSTVLPQLLNDVTGNWISMNDRVFLDGNVIGDFPGSNWVTDLKIISKDYQDEIEKQLSYIQSFDTIYGDTKTRKLYNWFNRFTRLSFVEQTTESIISPINGSIKGELNRAYEFISWLFECYKNKNVTLDVTRITADLNLPSNNGTVVRASQLFLGKDYHNDLGDALFGNTDYCELIAPEKIDVHENELFTFVEFAKKIRVLEFPLIERKKISNATFKENHLIPVIKKYLSRNNETRYWSLANCEFDVINNFETLINQLKTEDIIEWLDNDDEFQNQIVNHQSFGNIRFRVGQKWTDDIYHGNSPSYLKYLLNNTAWINVNNKRYSPNQIVFYEKLGQNITGICGIKKDKLFDIGFTSEIIDKLGFKKDVSMLSHPEIDEIIEFLNYDTDPFGEISKHVYGKLLDNTDVIGNRTTNQVKKIQIFCKDGCYYPNDEVKYAIDRPPSADKKTKFINIAYRKNSKIIKQWLGVSNYEFESKYKTHLVSEEIDNNYKDLEKETITTVAALSKLTDDNLEKIKKIKITHCSYVENSDNITLGNYDYANNDKDEFYIRIPNVNYSDLIRNKDYIESFVDILISKLRVNIDKDKIELYLSKSLEEQQERLFKDYDISWNEYYEKLWSSSLLTKKVLNWFSMEINNFDKTSEYKKVGEINYYNQDLTQQENDLIRNLLWKIGKDISDLSHLISINLISFYQKNIRIYISENQEQYEENCYYHARKGSRKDKSEYLQKIHEFKRYSPDSENITNSVYFDFKEMLMKQFPLLKKKKSISVDINSVYNDNVETLMKKLGIELEEFDYFIQNHDEYKSSLYFAIPQEVEQVLKNFLKQDHQDKKNSKSIDVFERETSTVEVKLQRANIERKSDNARGERSKRDYEYQNYFNDNAGETAERIAYLELKKTYPSLIWHSKYSKVPSDRNEIPPDSIVCDMWVKDYTKCNMYFEIKSSKNEFYMTISEYESMKKHRDTYEVVLVDRESKTISRHKFDELDDIKEISMYNFKFFQINDK